MTTALVGWSGFVGTTLLAQGARFDDRFRSTDIEEMAGRRYDTIVCAGTSAEKWRANQNPDADSTSIRRLIAVLTKVECGQFVLISTVDVFARPCGVDESSEPDDRALHPYGAHRLELEHFVRGRFANSLVVRLPGLVGGGLKKNVLYDLRHGHQLDRIDPRAQFQFYPMSRLTNDLAAAIRIQRPVVHLVAEPLPVGQVASQVFGIRLAAKLGPPPPRYDVGTLYAEHFGVAGRWQVSAAESIDAIAAYAAAAPINKR